MVTTFEPDLNKTDGGYSRDGTTGVGKRDYSESELADFLNEVYGNPKIAAPPRASKLGFPKVNTSFLSRVASPLLAAYRLVSGPPMSQRDRNRQTITEAQSRNSATLPWVWRTPW